MKKRNNITLLLLALIAGAILPFAFAPFNWYPIAFVSPALLLYTWLRSTPRQALWQGGLFGIGLFGVGASWIYISIHTFGNANTPLALLITALFVLILALLPATQGFLFALVFKNSRLTLKCLLAFPALWVIWEWLRSWVFSGFPWLFLGYTQMHFVLRGYAPLFGVYGVSLAVAFISSCLFLLFIHKSYKIKVVSVFSMIVLLSLSAGIVTFRWTKPVDKPITTTLVQGNISQSVKWDVNYLLNILRVYKLETEQHWDSKIIVWPESAIPAFPEQIKFYFKLLNKEAKKHKTAIVLGVPTVNLKTKQYYNSMMVIGNGKGIYLKRQLVPFGEYIPLHSLFGGAMKYFNIPMSNFSSGPWKQSTLVAAGIPIAPFICYEIAYPIEVLDAIQNKQMIVTVSDDSWFGRSIASPQQLQIAQMRALETGRYILYSTNTGVTAIVNPQGQLQAIAPTNKQATLTAKVSAMAGKTPLMRWNYYPVLIMVVLLLLISFFVKIDSTTVKEDSE